MEEPIRTRNEPLAPEFHAPPQLNNEKNLNSNSENGTSESRGGQDQLEHMRTTELQTFIHLVKGYVGPGCLSLPWAFSQLGIPLGFVTTVSLSALTSYNALSVMEIKRAEMNNRSTTYSDLGDLAYGKRFRNYVTVSICAQQLAICTVFFSFIGENVSVIFQHLSQDYNIGNGLLVFGKSRVVMATVFPVIMALSCLPNLKVLVPVTAYGTFFLLITFTMVGIMGGTNWKNRPEELPDLNTSTIPLAVCAIMYSYEGINLLLPIESSMKNPSNFERTFLIAMAAVVLIFSVFAIMCVVVFGQIENGSITAYLMENNDKYHGDYFVIAANIIVSLSVLLTYPLQMFPCITIISQVRYRRMQKRGILRSSERSDSGNRLLNENGIENGGHFVPLSNNNDRESRQSRSGLLRNTLVQRLSPKNRRPMNEKSLVEGDSSIMRALLVTGTFIVAFLVPNIQELISLAGALAGSSTALIIPDRKSVV